MPPRRARGHLLEEIALEWRLIEPGRIEACRASGGSILESIDERAIEELLLEKEWRTRCPPVLDRYPIERFVGAGASARVYQVRSTGGHAALKVLKAGIAGRIRVDRRFDREVRIISELRHANVVDLLDEGESLGRRYLVMSWLDGCPLDVLFQKRTHDRETLLDYCLQVVDGVTYAHQQGVIHRDLKPSNAFVTDDGVARVLDFGLARFVDPATVVTAPGSVLGTPLYMAPEQAFGLTEEVSRRSDVYSLGAIVYEVLTGFAPHLDAGVKTRIEWLQCLQSREPTPPGALVPDVPAAVASVAMRALSKAPADRFDSAAELGQALREATSRRSSPIAPAPARPKETPRPAAERAIVTLFVGRDAALGPVRHTFPIDRDRPFVLGRGNRADLRPTVVDRRISREHCVLDWRGRELVALNRSPNGTLVNGVEIGPDGAMLEPGDVLSIGDVSIEVRFSPVHRARGDAVIGAEHSGYVFESLVSTTEAGAVYRAYHREIRRPVLVDVFWATRRDDASAQRFFRMIRMARSLTHPNVIQVLDCGRIDGAYPFVVRELFDGASLSEALASGRMALEPMLDCLLQIASALEFAHSKRIVHRDVQPDNILVGEDGVAKLTGLGLAKSLDPEEEVLLTGPRQSRGNPAYAAPEQLLDARRAGPAADIFSLGAVLFHALTGRPPGTEVATDWLEDARGDRVLAEIAARAMAGRPEARYPSVAAMAVDLRKVRQPLGLSDSVVDRMKGHFLAMFPESPEIPGFEIAVGYEPAEDVGGDFYDCFPLDERRFAIVIGDVAGHGIPAAILVGMARTSARIFARQCRGPAEALAAVHEELVPVLPGGIFVTLSMLSIDLEDETISYARGGHNPMHVYNAARSPRWTTHEPQGTALALARGARFVQEEAHLHLELGDLILLHSDGVVEAMNIEGDLYTRERLLDEVEALARAPVARLVDSVMSGAREWSRGVDDESNDDRTLLAIRYIGG